MDIEEEMNEVDYKKRFRELRRYQAMGLEAKIRYADRLIVAGLEMAEQPCVAWSGGKDSTVLLHRVRRLMPDVVVMYSNTGVEYPETLKFVRRVEAEWSLNLHVAKPEQGRDFWWCLEEHGYPLLGKAFAGRAMHESERQRKVKKSGARISDRCCYWCKEKPALKVERELGIDLVLLGIMSGESHRRKFTWAEYGDLRYNEKERVWKVHPLSVWTEADIWAYHERFDLPICELYAMGHKRNGCWPCGMDWAFKDNHLATLRHTHPKLWRFLMIDKGLGVELLKIKLALQDGQQDLFSSTWNIEQLIEQRPCFFDKL